MADPQSIPAPPSGTTVPASPAIPPPPSGDVVMAQPDQANTETVQPEQSFLSKASDFGASMGAGVAQAGLETVHGVSSLLNKIPGVGEYLAPKAGVDAEGDLAENIDKTPNMDKIYQQNPETMHVGKLVGYGGENLAEFLLGDEALKGVSLADKYDILGKMMKFVEKSPKALHALQTGANIMKAVGELGSGSKEAMAKDPLLARLVSAGMDAVRQGAVQGAQTTVKTGGDVKEGLKQGAETGFASGVLGGAFGLLGRAAEKAGDAGKAVQEASETGAAAPTKVQIGQDVAGQIQDANTKMHTDFETGIQGLKKKLGDATVPFQGSPLQKAAKEATEGKVEQIGTLGKEFKGIAGGSPETKNLLFALTDPEKTGELSIDELVQRRQQLGEKIGQLTKGATSSADRADVGVYQKLRDGIDETIDSLAKNSGKPEASQDYAALRGAYKDKVNLFKEPIIRSLMEPGVDSTTQLDNAGKELLAGKNKLDKINTLEQVIGPDGLKQFGQHIAQSAMADASTNGQINPAKFAKSWKAVDALSPEVKAKLFDMTKAQQGLTKLSTDLKSAANYQKLVRAGVLSTAGSSAAAVIPHGGLGMILGILGAGDFGKATDVLDMVANRPGMWKAFQKIGNVGAKAASSPTARVAKSAAAYGAGNALSNVMQGAQEPLSNPEEDQ